MPALPKFPRSRSLLVLALLVPPLLLSSNATAGVNQGGTLVAHDAGLVSTADAFVYPSLPPTGCDAVDAELPSGTPADGVGWVWKIYAAFPAGAHPRLKALAFGSVWEPAQIRILDGGVPDPYWDFQVPDDDWPGTPESGVGVSLHQTGTGLLTEVYWFAGYAYGPAIWTLRAHRGQPPLFVDDSFPPITDPIAGFSSIGFGKAGVVVCPVPLGACCQGDGACVLRSEADCLALGSAQWGAGITCTPFPCSGAAGACCLPDGRCVFVSAIECAHREGIPRGPSVPCDVVPCPPPEGACCYPSGFCAIWNQVACQDAGSTFLGPRTVCTPNPCAQPVTPGGCCLGSGQCVLLSPDQCAQIAGDYLGDGTLCIPNPCPQPVSPGACCLSDGTCLVREEATCLGVSGTFQGVGVNCAPNPCPQPEGACCLADAACEVVTAVDCQTHRGTWLGPGVPCSPAPCDTLPGSCCSYDGSCRPLKQGECGGIFLAGAACDPNPCLVELGACCFLDGSCLLLLQGHCLANGGFYWWEATSCAPNPCDATLRLVETNWGKIKFLYRR